MEYSIVEKLKKETAKVEKIVKDLVSAEESSRVKNIISKDDLIITYSSLRKIPATTLYWILTVLNTKRKQPVLSDITSFLTHIAPYRKDYSLLAITSNPSSLKRLHDVYRLLNVDMVVLSETMPKGIKYSNVMLLDFGNTLFQNNLGYTMYLSSLALEIIPETLITRRTSKLCDELINIASIIPSLFERYKDVLNNIVDTLVEGRNVVFLTPSYLRNVIDTYLHLAPYRLKGKIFSHDLSIVFEECPKPRNDTTYVICRTGVEELSYKFAKFSCGLENLLDLNLNVDPVSASTYLLLLMEYIFRYLNTVCKKSHNNS